MHELVCLSVRNPLSYLICAGVKDVENRTWKTDYRGRLYIHSSGENHNLFDESDFPEKALKSRIINKQIDELCQELTIFYEQRGVDWKRPMKKDQMYLKAHAIIGYVDLVDIVRDSTSPFAIAGQYHWILKNPVMIDPITSVSGKLSLWRYQHDGVL